MGLFNKVKKSSAGLRTLTEDEIRRRLYGAYQAGEPDVEKKNVKTPEPPEPSSPRVLATKEKELESPKIQDDLFAAAQAPAPKPPQEKRSVSVPEEISEQERMKRLAEIAEREKRRPPPYLKPRDPWQNPPVDKKSIAPSIFLSKFASVVFSALGVGMKFLLSFIVFIFASVAKLLGLIDLRKPEVRRALYWIAGALVLGALFLSVHLLNVRREAAMKTPESSSVRQAAPAPRQESREVSRPAVVRESANAASSGRQRSEALQPVSEAEETQAGRREEVKKEEAPMKTPAPPPVSEGRYVIQVATYASSEDANRIAEQLLKEGDSVFVRALSRPSGKVYHALFLGRFESFQESQLKLEKFRKKSTSAPFEDAFIRTLES